MCIYLRYDLKQNCALQDIFGVLCVLDHSVHPNTILIQYKFMLQMNDRLFHKTAARLQDKWRTLSPILVIINTANLGQLAKAFH